MAVNGIDASYYTVIDLPKMTDFYVKVLGEPEVRAERWSEWTFADGSSFGIYMAGGKTGGRSGSVMFAVDDVPAMAKQAQEAGATIDDDHELIDMPSCQMMFADDPEGNQFILHKRKT
jgi:predicted enzyme related to lactoylglutathione lyase